MDPWYKTVTLRKEVREGRSFNPDEFAIALEQVVAGKAPEDYNDPKKFFARTCFTRALKEHAASALRRLGGKTENTAPVLALVTQFGGGKTHTLTALYHIVQNGKKAWAEEGVKQLVSEAGLSTLPNAKVGVFVGNAWDPSEGRETPWVDLAYQLAGKVGVEALGPDARKIAPGTDNIRKLFEVAGGSVLILCDEVLNFTSRHRNMAEGFRDFLGNLVRALTGTTHSAAIVSLPQSKPEMSDWDQRWQDLITKEINRVARNLISNDEKEISEVIRRRLFEDIGDPKARKQVSKIYADWCFEKRAELPPEWTAVDVAATEAKAKDLLRERFESCFPFHPATLSVFQRKWQTLAQYQQTRGTLAMLAQWISRAAEDSFKKARKEPLITLGSAPLEIPEFRATILGQLGEPRLGAAIEADLSANHSHARALDADTPAGQLHDIHRRVGKAVLFESSGGQVDKIARLPELRFAVGEPGMETTSVDNALHALESRAFFISKAGSDGYKIHYKANIRKAVGDRRASLDEETEVVPTMRRIVESEFRRGVTIPLVPFPQDGNEVTDSPKLTIVAMDPGHEWSGQGKLKDQLAEWMRHRGKSPRLYPGALVWCVKKPGRELRDKVEFLLAWKRVAREVAEGTLGADYDRADRIEIEARAKEAEEAAKDEVWGGYRFLVIADQQEPNGIKVIDLGAGHASGSETLCGRVIAAMKAQALLNESVGAGYLERNWPESLKSSGAWPLPSLRQCFLNGSLTRLIDPDAVLRNKIPEFIQKGEFGLASGPKPDGTYDRVWFEEMISADEVAFDSGVFLLTKSKAKDFKAGKKPEEIFKPTEEPAKPAPTTLPAPGAQPVPSAQTTTIRLTGSVPPEVWNRLGTKILPKLRSGTDLRVGVDFSVTVNTDVARSLESDLKQILEELGLSGKVDLQSG